MTTPYEPAAPTPHRRSRRATVLPLILILLFTVLLVGIGGEIYARQTVGKNIADTVSDEVNKDCLQRGPHDPQNCEVVGVPVRTSFGKTPILFSLRNRILPSISVRVGPFPQQHRLLGTVVVMEGQRVNYADQNNIHFGHATTTLHIPPAALRNQINTELADQSGPLFDALKVSKIQYLPNEQQIRVELGNGLITLYIVPRVQQQHFVLDLQRTEVIGSRQPTLTTLLRRVIPTLANEYMQILPSQFHAQEVKVEENALVVKVTGENFWSADLQNLAQ